MGTSDIRAAEMPSLVAIFLMGRDQIVDLFPASLVELYDRATARAEWATAGFPERARIIGEVLDADADLDARYRADVDAGRIGFGSGPMDVEDSLPATDRARKATAADDGPPPPPPPAPAPVPAAPAPVPAMPAPAPAPAEDVATWLNAQLTDPSPVRVAQPASLAVFFGAQSAGAAASQQISLPFAAGDDSIDLSVQLVSSDFTVPPFAQQLRIGRDGTSTSRAIFEITPLAAGPATLSVLVDVRGNFLQRLDITFAVQTADSTDAAPEPAPEVTAYGRPAAAATVLAERTATMQFLPTDGGYQLIARQVSPDPIDVLITAEELANRIDAVRAVLLDAVKRRPVALEMDIAAADNTAILQPLAFAGFRLFQSIFAGPQASDALVKVGRWLRESLSGDTATLQVVATGFPVPWALMYLTDRFDQQALTWDDFIGMRHVVEQIPLVEITAVPPATTIASTPALSVRALYNDTIDDSMPSKPVAAQRAYWEARGVALTEGTAVKDLVTGGLSASATDEVLYLYCHAEASATDSDASRLILTGSESVTLGQLQVFAPLEDKLPAHPLVFLNACESGELTPRFYDGFVAYFLAKGARGVIGTECKTPGLFASEWAKAFFDDLFTGKPLGAVVLDLRRRFLAEHNNPLGLLYGVHCDVDTVVAPALPAPALPAPALPAPA